MCGIFGIRVISGNSNTSGIIKKLYKYSETRGKEASGAIFSTKENVKYLKTPYQASKMLKSKVFSSALTEFVNSVKVNSFGVFLGHSRLVTNGSSALHENNQPIKKGQVLGVHNGIVINEEKIWQSIPNDNKEFDVDTESVIASINSQRQNHSIIQAIQNSFKLIEGVANIATIYSNSLDMTLATNNGSLYYARSDDNDLLVFASERFIIEKIISEFNLDSVFSTVKHIEANTGVYATFEEGKISEFDMSATTLDDVVEHKLSDERDLSDISDQTIKDDKFNQAFNMQKYDYCSLDKKFYPFLEKILDLKRCTKCVLPETMPFIEFDDEGVCNYCRNYKKLQPKGKIELIQELEKYKKSDGSPDCLMTFSGGRDSSFALHYAKKELGLNPIAYTYDWGVITDLGRRNQSRMCQQLGIEHIIISADIKKKRSFIKKNVEAWLKKPDLGMIPLFMAGDKQYFYYANQVAKQNNLDLIFLNGVALEQTHFKYGFCNVKPKLLSSNDGIVRITDTKSQMQLVAYYLKQYLLNPAYVNSSLLDTIGAFFSYYVIEHNYLRFFQYIPWDEKEIEDVLLNEYDWETLSGHNTTWRIGDGTSHFYNYIYYMITGLTENDTFRSNQIREGMITREEALKIVQRDNMPQWESMQWYCETMGWIQ